MIIHIASCIYILTISTFQQLIHNDYGKRKRKKEMQIAIRHENETQYNHFTDYLYYVALYVS